MKVSRAVLVLLVTLSLVPSGLLAWKWRQMPHLGMTHDDGVYLVSAKALASGDGYRIDSFPGTPYQTKYPPLFPLLLSTAWRLDPAFPGNLPWIALAVWLMLPLTVCAAWWYFRDQKLEPAPAALLCAWIAVNPVAVLFSILLMSELMFTALLLVALALAERALRGGNNSTWWAIGAGLAAGAAFLTRNVALPLLVAVPLCMAWKRRRRAAMLFAGCMAPFIAGWEVWAAVHRSAASDMITLFYTDYFRYYRMDLAQARLGELVWTNVSALIQSVWQLAVFDTDKSLTIILLSRLLAAGAVVGAIRLARQGRFVPYSVFAALFCLQLLIWNWPPDPRFVLPLLPLILVSLYTETCHLAALIRVTWRKGKADRAAAILCASAVILLVFYAGRMVWMGLTAFIPATLEAERIAHNQTLPAYAWLAAHTSPEQAILSRRDPLVYLYTGRSSVCFHTPPHSSYRESGAGTEQLTTDLAETLQRFRIEYVLRTKIDAGYDPPAMQTVVADESRFVLVFHTPAASVYEIRPPPALANAWIAGRVKSLLR